MCRALKIYRSGFYAWTHKPVTDRTKEDLCLLAMIRASYEASGCTYGSRRVYADLREAGEGCGLNRVAMVMRENKIRALRGYKKPRYRYSKPHTAVPNQLEQQFTVGRPNAAWVTDITYIRTWQGWLYLATVLDLYARKVVVWSMKPTLEKELVLDAVLMAVWRRKSKTQVVIHSDQGSQYSRDEWSRFCQQHNLSVSMSRRGNCFDNAVSESFFSSLKKERIRKQIYRNHDEARMDVFDYIEVFYHRNRRHSHLGGMNPDAFEQMLEDRQQVSS